MKFKELINVIKQANVNCHQTIVLWRFSQRVCSMLDDSELVELYGDYEVLSVAAIDDGKFSVQIGKKLQ